MNNTEMHEILGTWHRARTNKNKTTTHKAEKMSNTGIYQKSKGFP